jgi:crotonobetainyl-CoA:carnitine CoA-transferase CaiB-like acyl-CoA transferase
MEKNGLDYASVNNINPRIIYGEISGYGKEGPWKNKPGQDLLLQAMSGLAFTTGNDSNNPVPFGVAVADILCGSQLVQGILGALIRRQKTGKGALIEISMMESLLDFQFELLTTYYTNNRQPKRSKRNNGNPLLSAPYGVYKTTDGYIALAMIDLRTLSNAIRCKPLAAFTALESFSHRDEIKSVLADHLVQQSSAYWLDLLHQRGLWAMEVLDWEKMINHEAYRGLEMEQTLQLPDRKIVTTRCPIRVNGRRLFSDRPAPKLGQHREQIIDEFIKKKS